MRTEVGTRTRTKLFSEQAAPPRHLSDQNGERASHCRKLGGQKIRILSKLKKNAEIENNDNKTITLIIESIDRKKENKP